MDLHSTQGRVGWSFVGKAGGSLGCRSTPSASKPHHRSLAHTLALRAQHPESLGRSAVRVAQARFHTIWPAWQAILRACYPAPASSPYHSCISPPFRSVAHCRSRCGAMPVYHKLTQRCAFHPATPARHTQPPTAPCHAQPSVFVLIPPFSSRVSLPRSPNRRHDCGLAPRSPPPREGSTPGGWRRAG